MHTIYTRSQDVQEVEQVAYTDAVVTLLLPCQGIS